MPSTPSSDPSPCSPLLSQPGLQTHSGQRWLRSWSPPPCRLGRSPYVLSNSRSQAPRSSHMNIKQFSRGPASKLRMWPTGICLGPLALWSAPAFLLPTPSSLTCAPCFTPSLKGYPPHPSLRTPKHPPHHHLHREKVMSPSSVLGLPFPATRLPFDIVLLVTGIACTCSHLFHYCFSSCFQQRDTIHTHDPGGRTHSCPANAQSHFKNTPVPPPLPA